MRDIDRRFVEHKNEVHDEGFWVIVFCDNLSAHLDPEAKQIFGVNNFSCATSPQI